MSGYDWTEGQYRPGQIKIGVRPSGAFLSNVQNLEKWDAALYADEPLSPSQRAAMWTPVKLKDGSEKPYGFGWYLGKVGRHRQVYHAGTHVGFRSVMTRFVDDRLTVIVLANCGQALPEKIPKLYPSKHALLSITR